MKRHILPRLALGLLGYLYTWAAIGQTAPTPNKVEVDFTTPEVSALSFIDVNSDNIIRPGNVKKLNISFLTTAFDKGAAPIGVEWSPFQTFLVAKDLQDYARKTNLLYSLTVTGAYVHSEDNSVRIAYGLSWTPIDQTNPYGDAGFYTRVHDMSVLSEDNLSSLSTCLVSWQGKITELAGSSFEADELDPAAVTVGLYRLCPLPTTAASTLTAPTPASVSALIVGAQKKAIDAGKINDFYTRLVHYYTQYYQASSDALSLQVRNYSALVKAEKDKFVQDHWNAPALKLGIGGTSFSADGSLGGISQEKLTAFVTLAGSLNGTSATAAQRWHQFVLQGKFTVPGSSGKEETDTIKSAVSIGGKLYVGKARSRALAQLIYTSLQGQKTALKSHYETWQFRFGYEFRLTEGFYASVETGFVQNDFDLDKARLLGLANLKYSFGSGKIAAP